MSFWDGVELIGEVTKSEHSKIKVERCTKSGKTYINMREWYNKSSDLEWKPGKSGMAIPEETFINLMELFKEEETNED